MASVRPNSKAAQRGKPAGSMRVDYCRVLDRGALGRFVRWLVDRAGGIRPLHTRTGLPVASVHDWLNCRRNEMAPRTRLALRQAVWRAGRHPSTQPGPQGDSEYDRLQRLLDRGVGAAPPAHHPVASSRGRWRFIASGVEWVDLSYDLPQRTSRSLDVGRIPPGLWKKWPFGEWRRATPRQASLLKASNPANWIQDARALPDGRIVLCFLAPP